MSAIAVTDDLFFNRAGLDRGRAERTVADALNGGDDGELFLEFNQSEALAFDDGKLKSASFDVTQGFGLRAVAGEAHAYAHASDLSDAALQRAAATVKAVHAGHGGTLAEPPQGTNRHLYSDDNPLAKMEFGAKVALLQEIDAYARGQGSAGEAGDGLDLRQLAGGADHPRRRQPRRRYPPAGPAQRLGHGRGERPAWRPAATAPAGASPMSMVIDPAHWQASVDEALRQAFVNLGSVPAPAGEMQVVLGAGWPGILLHEAIGHGLEGDFNRKKTSAFAGLMGKQVAAKGVTVIDDGTIQDRRGSLTIDDEGTPSQRTVLIEDGILTGYHAGPAERAPDGHEADRQRTAPELRPSPDAAHDQHHHAGRQPRAGRDHPLGEEGPLRRQFRRRPGRHHLGQVRVLRLRGLSDRGRQGRPRGQGRDPDRQRPGRADQGHR